MRRGPIAALAPVVLALALTLAGPAQANRTQESIMQDDRVLTLEGEQRQIAALDEMRALGVDTIRTVVNWRRVAPSPDSATVPEGFESANPASYPAPEWNPYDLLVRNASARGITILMTPAGPIPNWASGCENNVNRACRPNPSLYGGFVAALAKRYSGSYVDESDGQTLPRVSRWAMWNEPNLASWIYPQKEGKRRVGPIIYRRLAHEGISALRANGHGGSHIVLGETAPLGSGSNTAPKEFWRELMCAGRNARGKRPRDRGCRRPKRFDVQGVAHHPYTRGAGQPLLSKPPRGAITFKNLRALDRLLALGVRKRVLGGRLPIWLTEFAVTSNPPDTKFGMPLPRQAEALNQAEYLAYRNSRVRGMAQFAFEDDTGLADKLTFQTGLKFGEGTPKGPTLNAYRLPVYVMKRGRKRLRVFGQVRPARDPGENVEIQNLATPDGEWQTVKAVRTARRGFLLTSVKRRKGLWRLRWEPQGGGAFFSRAATVARGNARPGARPPDGDFTQAPPGGGGSSGGGAPDSGGGDTGGGGPPGEPTAAPMPVYAIGLTFRREPNLLGTSSGEGTVTFDPGGHECTSECQRTYPQNTVVTLTATASEGSEFRGWEGEGCSGIGQCAVTMSRTHKVTAIFRRTAIP